MIALLTDFGSSDIYVGVMKSVILTIAPSCRIVDLTHEVPPQHVGVGALQIAAAWDYLPHGAVLVGVVDPGVGSDRRSIAALIGGKKFVGPDNGLISRVVASRRIDSVVELTNPDFQLPIRRGETFHGRDVFSPAAAHLEAGTALHELGSVVDPDSLTKLSIDAPQRAQSVGVLTATIALIDHFGNVVLDYDGDAFLIWSGPGGRYGVRALSNAGGPLLTAEISDHYFGGGRADIVLLKNSYGLMEIAIPNGNAARLLKVELGDSVEIIRMSQRPPGTSRAEI